MKKVIFNAFAQNFVNDFNNCVNPFQAISVTFDHRMKQYRTLLSVAFAFLVLFSSSNIMVGIHFCSGQIQNIALFSKAERCEMEKRMPPCHMHETQPCCEDETIIHNSEDFNSPPVSISALPVQAFDIEFSQVLISEVIPSAPLLTAEFYHYDPPLRAADLTVAFHTFLI